MAIQPGDTLLNGKYRILTLLGEGGFSRVWLAEEPEFAGRQVAVKEPRDSLFPEDQAELGRRFRQEVALAAAIQAARVPNVVAVHTLERLPDGTQLLVMEYMAGGSLADLIRRHPAGLPVARAVDITQSVLAALAALHALPVEPVHRDVKPENILLDGSGVAHLADFGLAQLPGVSERSRMLGGTHPGSPLYAAPEQEASPRVLTAAADLYALGCVLFEMLTGKRYKRYRPGTRASDLRPGVPASLDDLLAKALAEDPWERWQSASEMADALEASWRADLARQEAEARARREAEDQARREAEERARQERLAGWYAEARQAASANPGRALDLVAKIRGEAPHYPQLEALEARARRRLARQERAVKREGSPRRCLWLWALGVVLLLTAAVLAGWGLQKCGGATPTPVARATATWTTTAMPATDTPRIPAATVPVIAPSATATPSHTPTSTPSHTPTSTPTSGSTPSPTPTDTSTATATPTNTRTLTPTPRPKPTGSIAWVSQGDVYTADLQHTENPTRLTRFSDQKAEGARYPAWSPNGDRIAFAAKAEAGGGGGWDLFVMDADGTGMGNLTNSNRYFAQPCWSPDGSLLAISYSTWSGSPAIGVLDLESGAITKLTTGCDDRNPSWSPDGTKIAFESPCDGNYEIYVMAADGTNRTRLTFDGAYDQEPAWSPKGDKIAFFSDRGGRSGVYLMNSDGTDQNLMIELARYPAWSPDGRYLVAGRKVYEIARSKAVETMTIGSIGFEPDWSR